MGQRSHKGNKNFSMKTKMQHNLWDTAKSN